MKRECLVLVAAGLAGACLWGAFVLRPIAKAVRLWTV
jgi:hypothetical protein